jgi:hypothetical protein
MARQIDSGNGKPVSKAFAYRAAAKELGKKADLGLVQQYLREKFSIEMERTQISQYRTNEKKRKGKLGKRSRSSNRDGVVATAPTGATIRAQTLIDFVSDVRAWEHRIGAERICEVIGALYQKK